MAVVELRSSAFVVAAVVREVHSFFLPNCFALGRRSKENTLGPFSVSARARQDMVLEGGSVDGTTRKTLALEQNAEKPNVLL